MLHNRVVAWETPRMLLKLYSVVSVCPSQNRSMPSLKRRSCTCWSVGEKLKAVKLYRDRTGANLMESKLAVESVAARHGITVETAGCSGVLIVFIRFCERNLSMMDG